MLMAVSCDDKDEVGGTSGCDPIFYQPICVDGLVQSCVDGKLSQTYCEGDTVCEGGQCVDRMEQTVCSDLNDTPVCVGDKLKTCEDGHWVENACPNGGKCEEGECKQPEPGDACGGDFKSYCAGNGNRVFCKNEKIVSKACDSDSTCEEGVCVGLPCEASEPSTCDDDAIKRCVDGHWVKKTCDEVLNMRSSMCVEVEDNGAACIAGDWSCDPETFVPKCVMDHTKIAYCSDDGVIEMEPCSELCQHFNNEASCVLNGRCSFEGQSCFAKSPDICLTSDEGNLVALDTYDSKAFIYNIIFSCWKGEVQQYICPNGFRPVIDGGVQCEKKVMKCDPYAPTTCSEDGGSLVKCSNTGKYQYSIPCYGKNARCQEVMGEARCGVPCNNDGEYSCYKNKAYVCLDGFKVRLNSSNICQDSCHQKICGSDMIRVCRFENDYTCRPHVDESGDLVVDFLRTCESDAVGSFYYNGYQVLQCQKFGEDFGMVVYKDSCQNNHFLHIIGDEDSGFEEVDTPCGDDEICSPKHGCLPKCGEDFEPYCSPDKKNFFMCIDGGIVKTTCLDEQQCSTFKNAQSTSLQPIETYPTDICKTKEDECTPDAEKDSQCDECVQDDQGVWRDISYHDYIEKSLCQGNKIYECGSDGKLTMKKNCEFYFGFCNAEDPSPECHYAFCFPQEWKEICSDMGILQTCNQDYELKMANCKALDTSAICVDYGDDVSCEVL